MCTHESTTPNASADQLADGIPIFSIQTCLLIQIPCKYKSIVIARHDSLGSFGNGLPVGFSVNYLSVARPTCECVIVPFLSRFLRVVCVS
jgi:hypothetical protein